MKMMFLVDGENNITEGLNGIDMLSQDDTVLIFHQKGASLTKIKKATENSIASIQFVESVISGKNSMDFQIIAELGVLVGKNEVEFAYIISHDRGYIPSIVALKKRYSKTFKELDLKESIEDCLKLPFVLKTTNKKELNIALIKEYGVAHGNLLYNHLKSIFANSNVVKDVVENDKIGD